MGPPPEALVAEDGPASSSSGPASSGPAPSSSGPASSGPASSGPASSESSRRRRQSEPHPLVWVQKYISEPSKKWAVSFSRGHRAQATEGRAWFVIDANATWKVWFDVVSIIFTAVLCLVEPFVAAFDPRPPGIGRKVVRKQEAWIAALDTAQVFWFGLDILFSFATTYPGFHGSQVSDPRSIAAHYARGWLASDVFSTVPWDRIVAAIACSKRCARKGAPIAVLHTIPILRAVKLSKFARARTISPDPSDVVKIGGPAFDYVVAFVVSAFFVNHLFACVWYIIGDRARFKSLDDACFSGDFDKYGRSARCTWLQLNGYVGQRDDGTFRRGFLYTTCLYWSVTTVTTVGYGDITANTAGEKVFAMFVEVVGVALMASLITTFSAVMFAETDAEEEHRRLKLQVKKFIAKHRFPPDLALAVISFLRRAFDVDKALGGQSAKDDDKAVSDFLKAHLNQPLKRAVALHLADRDPVVSNSKWFTKASHPIFVADCVVSMQASIAGPMEILVPVGTVLDMVHIVCRGSVGVPKVFVDDSRVMELDCDAANEGGAPPPFAAAVDMRAPEEEGKKDDDDDDQDDEDDLCFGVGDHFGDEGILLGAAWEKPSLTTVWTELSLIPRDALLPLLDRFPEIHRTLKDDALAVVEKYPNIFTVGGPDDAFDDVVPRGLRDSSAQQGDKHLRDQLDALQRQMALVLKALDVEDDPPE